jgi:hypothetical protein
MICFNRVEARVLQRISLQFGHQSNTTPLLMFLDHQTASFLSNSGHGYFQLVSAVTTEGSEDLAGETLRMEAQERSTLHQIAQRNRERSLDVSTAGYLALKAN